MAIPPNGVIFGHPADDPTCNLWWLEFVPSGPVPAGGWPCVLLYEPSIFRRGTPAGMTREGQFLALNGFICFSCTTRLVGQIIDGQTTTGYSPQQTADVRTAILAAKADSRVNPTGINGGIAGLGGSAGGSHVAMCCGSGPANERFTVGVSMSGAYNYAERTAETYTIDGADPSLQFALNIDNYFGHSSPTSGGDLAIQLAGSPVTLIDANMAPFVFYQSEFESMPYHQYTDMLTQLMALGVTAFHSDVNVASNLHDGRYWDTRKDEILAFLKDPTTIGTGGTPPPPPDIPARGYKLTLSGGDYTLPNAIQGQYFPDTSNSAGIVILDPNTNYVASLIAYNEFGDSPAATYNFRSNPSTIGTPKTQPRGNFALLSSPGGVWGDVSGFPLWDLSNIDGVRARTGWTNIQSGGETSYSWDQIDTLSSICATKTKKYGLSISFGINTPSWVFAADETMRFTEHGPDAGDIPLIWNAAYLAKAQAFIQAMGARYDGDSRLAYVVAGGMGQVIEMFYVQQTDFLPADTLAKAAGYPDFAAAYLAGAQAILSYFLLAFPTTPIISSLARPMPQNRGSDPLLHEYADAAVLTYLSRYGNMSAALNGVSNSGFISNGIVQQYSPTNPAGFQFGHPSTNPACDTSQDPMLYSPILGFTNTLANGITLKMKYCEMYINDAQSTVSAYVTAKTNNRTLMAALP